MKARTILLVALLATQGLAHASQRDKRIRQEVYSPDRVYTVYTKIGRPILIQLEDGENVNIANNSLFGLGDPTAWDVGIKGNSVALRPKAKQPDTTITMVSNKRTYFIDIVSTNATPTYGLRFTYPDTKLQQSLAEQENAKLTFEAKQEKVTINTNYVWRGDNDLLRPTAAWDDGRFTKLAYDNSAELPVFFKVLPDGTESLINSHIDPNERHVVVIHEVIRTLRARLGNDVIEVINKGYKQPKFNKRGSTEHGTVRIKKKATP